MKEHHYRATINWTGNQGSGTVQSQDMVAQALALHKKANECCFIANSVNFPVHHQPTIVVKNKA